jgi:hypothetical protein
MTSARRVAERRAVDRASLAKLDPPNGARVVKVGEAVMGYDTRQSLGDKETGARAALPIWMDFMKSADAGKDEERFPGT